MFHGEGVPILKLIHYDYVSNLFHAWKGDVAPAGAFRNSTIDGLSHCFGCNEFGHKRMYALMSAMSTER